ncbi:hypothetical protein GCK72_020561 [Caenorhabditis remanei]|uniref:Uncharacterized protein n=1 Tax=Caenorhabditis remanei TaxID=31234 RepID=A0A6A5GH39_CAERE|nr:hypothetical protein GCK72_020561 [Caenorhabditis remanei]KAF1754003.1 hypothetical protein GCK72_020561 [Caenorhabditis remanei]
MRLYKTLSNKTSLWTFSGTSLLPNHRQQHLSQMRVVEPEQHHEHGNKKLQDGGNTDADRELHSQRRSTYQMAQTNINNKCENTYNWNYAK